MRSQIAKLKPLALAAVISVWPLLLPYPSQAQFADVRQQLNKLPTSRVVFARGASSTTIENTVNKIYILRATARQRLTLKVNSLGARASITLYGVDGKPMGLSFSGASSEGKERTVVLPKTGNYYIVGGSGPTNHAYNFTVTIK
ncbi:MAG TPA: hypothetical protein V6D48_18665 [Oculatellaceae cyanobacterium]